MAFRFKPHESVADGLRRVALRQLRSAHDEVRRSDRPTPQAIHKTRKGVKKLRAIVELIDADNGRGLGGCQKTLRKVNRALSDLRDADAMLETLAKLKNKDRHLFEEHALATVRRHLLSHKQTVMKAAHDDGAWKKIERGLRTLRKRAKRWRPSHGQFGALEPGIRAAYRHARGAKAQAQSGRDAGDFHAWRKQIKRLWYQLRLIGVSAPLRTDVRLLHHAETWLGDDHNIAVLCAELSKDPSVGDLGRLRRVADRCQDVLRRKAIASTRHLFAHEPASYVRRIKRAWKAGRGTGGSQRTGRRRRAAAA